MCRQASVGIVSADLLPHSGHVRTERVTGTAMALILAAPWTSLRQGAPDTRPASRGPRCGPDRRARRPAAHGHRPSAGSRSGPRGVEVRLPHRRRPRTSVRTRGTCSAAGPRSCSVRVYAPGSIAEGQQLPNQRVASRNVAMALEAERCRSAVRDALVVASQLAQQAGSDTLRLAHEEPGSVRALQGIDARATRGTSVDGPFVECVPDRALLGHDRPPHIAQRRRSIGHRQASREAEEEWRPALGAVVAEERLEQL